MKTTTYTSAVVPGTFGSATNVAQVTVTAQGAITAASNVAIAPVPLVTAQRVLVYQNAAQVHNVGTVTIYGVVVYDPSAMFSGGTTVTIPATGIYDISHGISSSGGGGAVHLSINGGAYFLLPVSFAAGNSNGDGGMTWRFNAGDTIQAVNFGAVFTNLTTAYTNFLSVARVS